MKKYHMVVFSVTVQMVAYVSEKFTAFINSEDGGSTYLRNFCTHLQNIIFSFINDAFRNFDRVSSKIGTISE
jgi:hypothetical protein